jgi:hypothetical protein
MAALWSSLELLAKRLTTNRPEADSVQEEKLVPALPRLPQASRELARGGTNVVALFDALETEITRAQRYRRELSIAVFDVPIAFARDRQFQLQNSVRNNVRGTDLPIWISNSTLALVLPETGQGAAAATERIARVLADVAGGPVASGYARFPEDGNTASELVRRAVRQKRVAPICAVGGHSWRREIAVDDPQAALPEGTSAEGTAAPGTRATDGVGVRPIDRDAIELARGEFLRAALHLAELEALSRDPGADDAAKRTCLRELAAYLEVLDTSATEGCASGGGAPAVQEGNLEATA